MAETDIEIHLHAVRTPAPYVQLASQKAVDEFADALREMGDAFAQTSREMEAVQFQFIELLENLELVNARLDNHLDHSWQGRLRQFRRWVKSVMRRVNRWVDEHIHPEWG